MIKIPLKLVSEANSKGHWTKGAKRHKQQKWLVEAFLSHYYPNKPIPCTVKMTRYAPRTFDSDNLQTAFKYIRDAISEYLLDCKRAGRADSDNRIEWQYGQEKTNDKEYYITIEVYPKCSLSPSCIVNSQSLLSEPSIA